MDDIDGESEYWETTPGSDLARGITHYGGEIRLAA
jgi:hypothetical protein